MNRLSSTINGHRFTSRNAYIFSQILTERNCNFSISNSCICKGFIYSTLTSDGTQTRHISGIINEALERFTEALDFLHTGSGNNNLIGDFRIDFCLLSEGAVITHSEGRNRSIRALINIHAAPSIASCLEIGDSNSCTSNLNTAVTAVLSNYIFKGYITILAEAHNTRLGLCVTCNCKVFNCCSYIAYTNDVVCIGSNPRSIVCSNYLMITVEDNAIRDYDDRTIWCCIHLAIRNRNVFLQCYRITRGSCSKTLCECMIPSSIIDNHFRISNPGRRNRSFISGTTINTITGVDIIVIELCGTHHKSCRIISRENCTKSRLQFSKLPSLNCSCYRLSTSTRMLHREGHRLQMRQCLQKISKANGIDHLISRLLKDNCNRTIIAGS